MALDAEAARLGSEGVAAEDIWSHNYPVQNPETDVGFINGVEQSIPLVDTFGTRALTAANQLRQTLDSLTPDFDFETAITVARLALLGPAGVALDHVTGKLIEATVGDAIGSVFDKASTVLVAGAHNTDFRDAQWLIGATPGAVAAEWSASSMNAPNQQQEWIDRTLSLSAEYKGRKEDANFLVQAMAAVVGGVKGAGKYAHLKEPNTVGPGLETTTAQRRRILEENRRQNGGVLRSDESGVELTPPRKLGAGETRPRNEANVDHIDPRSRGGSNSNANQRVTSFEENLRKSDKLPGEQ